MRLETKIFSSKISLRIFATFVVAALVPIGCLAVLVYFQVTQHLQNQAIKSLRHSAKSQAKTLDDRLKLVAKELEFVNFLTNNHTQAKTQELDAGLRNRLLKRFNSLTLFVTPDQPRPFLNQSTIRSLDLGSDDIRHMSAGNTLLAELNTPQTNPSIGMLRLVEAEKVARGFFVGEINLNYLWATDEFDNLPLDTEFCVLDSAHRLLFISKPSLSKAADILKINSQASTSGHFEFTCNGEQYLACYSQLFMKPNFKLPHWTVILFKAKSDVFAPLDEFRIIFPLFLILTLMVVVWLSIANIRKNLVPIGALKKGAQRIAQRDFSQKVSVSSQDEFEELAVAFNEMSDALDHKFKTLLAKADIDRAVLSSLNREDIIRAAITRVTEFVACHFYGVNIIDPDSSSQDRALCSFALHRQTILTETVEFTAHDRKVLAQNANYLIIHANDTIPHYLPATISMQLQTLLILPIWDKKNLAAVLWLGICNSKQFTDEDITLARQLADQIAVALSNSSLIEKLKEMNWGTLQALARTVDAKSPWTAGHSQRVAEMALQIGSALQLNPESLENLHRAALLHDIGKVGIPLTILDKQNGLNDEEFQLVKLHPELGAKIIEPINAYRELIPIIAQHHERFDGKGYPDKLAGEAIHPDARILAVADVYDALSSDRPYRKGLPIEEVLEIMQKETGSQFDPAVVKALLKIIEEGYQIAV